jgi:heat shock protein HtpX
MLRATGARTHIWNNGIRSVFLLALFPVFVILIVYAQLIVKIGFTGTGGTGVLQQALYALPANLPWITLGILAWFAVAYFLNVHIVGIVTGAHTVTRKEEPALYNLLENLCIAKGMQMPRLRIMETEALNGYASGMTEKQYTVAVTRGLMTTLSKDELEAVLAHELAHIAQGDARLMVIASVFVGVITLAVEMILRNRGLLAGGLFTSRDRDSNKNGATTFLLVIVAVAVLFVARFLSAATQMALSRAREYMADMEAVQTTRNPDAMVSALLAISGKSDMADVPDDIRGMFFDNSKAVLGGLFATHPGIDKRVSALRRYGGAREAAPPAKSLGGIWV